MRLAVWFTGLAIAVACSATTPTPNGTVLASWKASAAKWPQLASAAGKATGASDGSFGAASEHGASVDFKFKTGVVEIDGKKFKTPLEATATVSDAKGFAISGSFSDGPIHFAGMPEDVRALDFRAQLTSGTRSCAGTSYKNSWLRVRLFGDGTAKVLPEPVAYGSVAPPALSP
jgi:hypothetical protein